MHTIKSAAEKLGMSPSRLYELVAKKKISHYRDGAGPIRFSDEHLAEYLASIEHGRGETWPVERRDGLRRLKI